MIVDLGVCADLPLERIGGKAKSVALLRRAGFKTPPGFVVTTDAHRAAVTTAGRPQMPQTVRQVLIEAWRARGWARGVVRSSAVLEDRPDLSFAGQLESVLDVRSEDALIRAVEQVQASARSERVRTYLQHRLPGADPDRLLCACLIQPLLDPECAGVVFTIDPASGAQDRLLLECVPGLGEALVSGAAKAEQHVVSRGDLAPLSSRPAGDGEALLLTPELVRAVAETALRIEAAFGVPQDIEWAIVDGEVVVLQARPVTVLPTVPTLEAAVAEDMERLRAHGPGVWTSLFLAEVMPTPTLASLELYRMMGTPGTGGVLLCFERDVGLGRVDHAMVMDTICAQNYGELRSLERILSGMGLAVRIVPRNGVSSWPRFEWSWVRPRWGRLLLQIPWFLWLAVRVAFRVRSLLRNGARRFLAEDLPAIEREVTRGAVDPCSLDDRTLLRELDTARAWCSGAGRRIWERGNQAALWSFGVLSLRTRFWLGDRDGTLATALVRGAPGNATLELHRAICALAEITRKSDEKSEEFEPALARFLDGFGHRSTTELELSDPRWREDPSPIRAAVSALANRPGPVHGEEGPPPIESVVARAPRRHRHALRKAVETARRNAFLRETPKFHYLRRLEQLRLLYLEAGRRAAERGTLERPDDVFHLSRQEVGTVLGDPTAEAVRQIARARRERRALLLTLPPLPQVIRIERLEEILAEVTSPPVPGEEDTLRGEGVSPGRVTGRVHVVVHPAEAESLGRDAVLVAPRTDPGWTPLFIGIRGVVVETGSAISHTSIVAREYGLPMVVNVPAATKRLRNGDTVSIDGAGGWVRVEGRKKATINSGGKAGPCSRDG